MRWRCGGCGKWHGGEEVTCPSCGTHMVKLTAVQVTGELSQEEQMFYANTVPSMVRTIGTIQKILSRIDDRLEELNGKIQD